MDLTLSLNDFMTDRQENKSFPDALERLSIYCNSIDSCRINIIRRNYIPFYIYNNKLTYPNVVEIEYVAFDRDIDILKVFPDLIKIKKISTPFDTTVNNMGNITEIDIFEGLLNYFKKNSQLKCKKLGKKNYLFTNGNYSQVVKINKSIT